MKTKMTIKDQKGSAIVEFAIVVPLMLLLVIGIGEFGLLWYNSQVITNASREGARAGIVLGADFLDDNAVKAIVTAYCDSRVIDFSGNTTVDATNDITLTPDDDRASSGFGDDFLVEVEYDYGFLVPALFGLGKTKKITGRTLMKMEQVLGAPPGP
jgi:Flp pilus assembly protein TadG